MKAASTISKRDREKYVLKEAIDEEILIKCKRLETTELNDQDKLLVKLIKTQLEDDWRTPLVKEIARVFKKYFKSEI
ncbi:MAG: hypothetical protein COX79_01155 [Candidatus Levybacteria bacterium CG_4_10_14_0_2_um_filter_36_16]|nr:MAG: hypothetical protein AUK12_03940 [Candidatus Levybacteria bacterium CG2_30_37_29]PIR79455.1 MAG: hypothetical protein COU26_01035 [Candidatus Levybacteria bacterium CG10_big_fil_rev_8_21_14_0_10_36_30]PIZ97742.1 MAG: hypothetical protein COX79_01155 [Candidatus Levybacteria bacterium CG_4_10_14_0_2_um_filter_36_16]PJA90707.1 MAG: hypothetical protein CO136_01060 [Candidatus Levybacteria bacterium CG_4_9_14_3_um_filter_36_7]